MSFLIEDVLILCFVSIAGARCPLTESVYIRTKVIQETSECVQNGASEEFTQNQWDCFKSCTDVDDCRRIMFNKETKLCSLFIQGENCYTSEDINNKLCYRQKFVYEGGEGYNRTRCPLGYYGDTCQHIITDCADGFGRQLYPKAYVVTYIRPLISGRVVEVFCDLKYNGWTFISIRRSRCRELSFNRTFSEYSEGFGNPLGSYFVGLETVFGIVSNHIQMTLSFNFVGDKSCVTYYGGFKIFNRSDNYRLSVASYNNQAKYCGDSISNGTYSLNGRPFSTYDQDYTSHSCPGRFGSGWWYLDDPVCSRANIFGKRTGDTFESMWHWQDNLGNTSSFNSISVRLKN